MVWDPLTSALGALIGYLNQDTPLALVGVAPARKGMPVLAVNLRTCEEVFTLL